MGINRWTDMGAVTTAADGPVSTSRFYFSRRQTLKTEMNFGPTKGSWASSALVGGHAWTGWHATNRLVASNEKDVAGAVGSAQYANNRPPYSSFLVRYCTDPLAAQTIDGTFDIVDFVSRQRMDPALSPQNDNDVRFQLYIYVTVGNSTDVRGVLLDYIDSVNFPFAALQTWRGLAAPRALTPVTCLAGDRVIIERGFRWVSMTSDPVPTYPVTTWSRIWSRYWGTQDGISGTFPDAVRGTFNDGDFASWCEFSPGLQMGTSDYPGPDANQIRFGTNDVGSFDNPIDMGDLPYRSPEIDTSRSNVPGEWGIFGESGPPNEKSGNAVYFKFTASQTGYVFFTARGTTFNAQIGLFYDPVTGQFAPRVQGKLSVMLGHSRKDPAGLYFQSRREFFYLGRSGSSTAAWAVSGQTYWVAVANMPMSSNHSGGPIGADKDAKAMGHNGGIVKIQGYYADNVPQQNDLYILNGALDVTREIDGEVRPVMLGDNLVSAFTPTGIDIDYFKKPLYSFGTGSEFEVADANPFGWLHSGERIVFADFLNGFQEIMPIDTLSWMPNTAEVDFMEVAEDIPGPFGDLAPSYLHIRRDDGVIYQAHFGSGFRLATGTFSSGSPPAILDSGSEAEREGTVYFRDIAMAASQLGNPWFDGSGLGITEGVDHVPANFPETGTTGMNFITIDEAANILYYTSSGFYTAFSNNTDVRADDPYVYRWDLTAGVNLPKLGPFTLFGTPANGLINVPPTAGLRGLKFIPKDGTLIVVNSDRIIRINSNGDLLQTYIPVHPDGRAGYTSDMTDVVLTAEQDAFWAKDGGSSAIYKFNLASGVQTAFFDPETIQGTTTQMTIYLPGGFQAPAVPTPRPIRRLRQAPHLHNELDWIFYERFQLELESGVGLESGQGSDPQVMLQWSNDGGYTWSNEYWESVGKAGEFDKRVLWYRLGRSRDRVFRVIMSDPVKWALLDAYILVKAGNYTQLQGPQNQGG